MNHQAIPRRVWITGAGGFIGSHLVAAAGPWNQAWWSIALNRGLLELTDFAAVRRRWEQERPGAIIHAAALSRASVCQRAPSQAALMNVGLTRVLADLAHDVPFLFLSTDLVFDGRKGDYTENDAVNPLSVYAETKARAEEIVLANPLHTVVRLALNTGISPTGARSFTEEMRRAAARGERLSLFTDEWRTPLPAVVTARVLWELLAGTHPPGLYHLGGGERLSRWEIGQLVARRWPALAGNIQPASLRDFTGPPRPADTSLNCAKIQARLPFKLPGLRQWMNENPGEPV